MAGKRKHPKVHIEEDKTRSKNGRKYLLLRYFRDGKSRKKAIGYLSDEAAEEKRADLEAELRAEALGHTLASRDSSLPNGPATVRDAVLVYLDLLEEMPGKPDHRRWEIRRCTHLSGILGAYTIPTLTPSRLKAYVQKRKGEPNEPRKRKSRDEVVPERQERRRPLPPQRTTYPRRATVFNEVCCLRRVVKAYHEAGHIPTPVTLPKSRDIFAGWDEDHRPARQLTEADVAALIRAGTYVTPTGTYAGRDRSWVGRLIGFLAWCPRRPVAIFGLRRRDCERVLTPGLARKERRIWVERDKGGKGRGWCPLSEPALGFLRDHLLATTGEPDDLVWRTEAGAEWDARKWWRVVQGVAERAGLEDVTTYDLRKFGAAQVYRRKPNLKVVMAYTGHKNPAVLLRNYIFPERDEAEEAAEGIGWTGAAIKLVDDADEDA